MTSRTTILFVLIAASLAACSTAAPQTQPATAEVEPSAAPGVLTPTAVSRDDLPLLEADVARISVEQAKAAVDSGQAILVDVRDAAAYERLHAAGARLIQLGEIETDAAGLDLDRERWIITYCT